MFLSDKSYAIELSKDASAALVMLRCAGVGCVRHLSTRLLWTQQKISAGDVNAHKANAALNPADLGTKGLARDTLLQLMKVVQTYDLAHGCGAGEEQMWNCLSSKAMCAAVSAQAPRASSCSATSTLSSSA